MPDQSQSSTQDRVESGTPKDGTTEIKSVDEQSTECDISSRTTAGSGPSTPPTPQIDSDKILLATTESLEANTSNEVAVTKEVGKVDPFANEKGDVKYKTMKWW